jgi:predicted TIM-barrel fold metal-dependent hydrolase
MIAERKRRIVDAHMHLFDHEANHYEFLEQIDPMFQALIGDYSTLPRRYLFEDYLADQHGTEVAGIVWHEFLSTDPIREVHWAQKMAATLPVPMAIVGLASFLAPDLEATLDAYSQCRNVTSVREHLGWDDENPMRRFAKRPDLLRDARWREGLKLLGRYNLKCSLELFSPQLPDLLPAVRENPATGFTIAVFGWPSSIDQDGFTRWKQSLAALATCENTHITISAVECVFGMNWSVAQVQPWVDTVLDLFGTDRTMFGSHRPISRLAHNFPSPYTGYEQLISKLSPAEQDAVLRGNAAKWFFREPPA